MLREPLQPDSLDVAIALEGSAPARAIAVDIEQLLVRKGWLWLRSRVTDGVLEIAMGTSTRRASAPQRLTAREFQVASLSARGLMAKEIGSELAIMEPTARGALGRALLKLEVGSGSRLIAMWNALSRPAQRFDFALNQTALVFVCDLTPRNTAVSLTSTERAILAGILDGSSNRAISDQRGTSERTVANQVGLIFKKFRVSTRRELSAKVLGSDDTRTLEGCANSRPGIDHSEEM